MKITEFIKKNITLLDGGTGTLLQAAGLPMGELPERWNISHPNVIVKIHKDYYDAGSNIVCTNTFGANRLKFSSEELENIVASAIKNAKIAKKESTSSQPKWVALDIGPTGKMLKPFGDLDFEEAVSVFAEVVRLGVKYGVDLIMIETMSDSYETKAALLAAKENSSLPVFVSNAYGEDGKLLTGATPAAMVAMLEGMRADAIGVNCSLGPKALLPVVSEYLKYSSVPVIVKPNAGLPSIINGACEYSLSPSDFSHELGEMLSLGARIVGGCCGTTPEYISSVCELVKEASITPIQKKNIKLVSSYARAVEFGGSPILIGERINPTGKPRFKEALKNRDIDYVLREGVAEEDAGAHILDVNVGLPGIDEGEMLCSVVKSLQAICPLPLQIDSSDPVAMEKALRIYNGKAMINSVNGKAESIASVFPLAKKYGGVVVALTLDENGIPDTAEGRFLIAKKIYNEARKYGIDAKDLIFDPLAMAVSADKNAARETLRAVKMIHDKLHCDSILGISNVSFGLPDRDLVNSTFLVMAMENGLSAAIVNPHSEELMKAYRGYLALSGLDKNFENYISHATKKEKEPEREIVDLKKAIIKGMKDRAISLTREMIKEKEPLEIINCEIIPALNEIGEGFEKKTVYLPSLLMSAEAASGAFEVIKLSQNTNVTNDKCPIVIATVKGDIHDIGKNIVKLILENYGYSVIDLGKDVAPEMIVKAAVEHQAKIVGLSALMTTTLPAMEESIRLLKGQLPDCKVIVGGAVLTADYAEKIGADGYAKDAMVAVRLVENINKE